MADLERPTWNEGLIRNFFLEKEVESILSIPLSLFLPPDSLIWIAEKNRVFTTKSAYHVVRSCSEVCGDVPGGSHLNADIKFL